MIFLKMKTLNHISTDHHLYGGNCTQLSFEREQTQLQLSDSRSVNCGVLHGRIFIPFYGSYSELFVKSVSVSSWYTELFVHQQIGHIDMQHENIEV